MNKKTAFVGLLSIAMLFLASAPSFAWVYPDCTEDLKFERFGPRVDRVVIRMYATEAIAFTNFENGQFDMTDWAATRYFLDRWSAPPYNETIKIIPYPYPGSERGYYILDMNNYPEPLLIDSSPNPAYPVPTSVSSFRHAIAHCINRPVIVANNTLGLSIPMYTLICPYMSYWKHPEIRPGGLLEDLTHPYNVTLAAEILTADHFIYNASEYAYRFWDGKPGSGQPQDGNYQAGEEFKLIFYGRVDHAWRRDIAVALATLILIPAPICIDVDLRLFDATTCWQKVMVEKEFHMYTAGWIFMGPEPDYLYDLYHPDMYWHPGDPPNYGYSGYNCPAFNEHAYNVKFPGKRSLAEIRVECLEAQKEFATPCAICSVPMISTAAPKCFARAYTGGNGGVLVGDGEDKYRGLMWKDIVNELGFGENSYWSILNAHPAGYETGDCQNMTLRYGFKVSSLRKLNIIYSSWYWDGQVLGLIYDTLMMRDPNTQADLIPWLAKKIETFCWFDPEDGMKQKTGVRVTLRPGIKWSDGTPLTAEDVKFTFMDVPYYLNKRGFPEPWWSSYVWPTAKSVYVVDPCNVVILYNYDAPAWAKIWVGIAVPIMPKHKWETIVKTGDPTPALPPNLPDPTLTGTGPFKRDPAADWYNPPSWIKLVKNTNFFHYCPIDVDPQIDEPQKYKGLQVFPPCTPADELKFTLQIQNMYWNQCRGSELWIDKYVYFSNATGEYLLPGYPHNIHLPGRNAFLQNITLVHWNDPVPICENVTYAESTRIKMKGTSVVHVYEGDVVATFPNGTIRRLPECRNWTLPLDTKLHCENRTAKIHFWSGSAVYASLISTTWEQRGLGCPPQYELFHVVDWEDNCDSVLSTCDKLFLVCLTDPLKTGWYHVETVNPVPPPEEDGTPRDPIMIEVAYEDKEHIDLTDLPYPYNTMTSWPKCHYDIKVAVHVKGPPMISVYTWTLAQFLAGTPAHYELVPNPWVCQWINVTFNFWVTIAEDLNLDCKVNILDAIKLAGKFGWN